MTNIRFYSALKAGLAASLPPPRGTAGLPASLDVPVSLEVAGTGLTAAVEHRLVLRGPGAVTGIDPGLIARRHPAPDTAGFESNLFPFVEFYDPGLPWRFSPATPDAKGRLAPWLALVVVPADGPLTLSAGTKSLPARLDIEHDAGGLLPSLSELHLWAHVQETGTADDPIRLARIVCAAHLAPETSYLACLVPVFEAGRLAGLGMDAADPATAAVGWTRHTDGLLLPVYDSWRFTTGGDDFETLARRLFPAPAHPRLGLRALDLAHAGGALDLSVLGLSDADPAAVVADFMGALTAPSPAPRSLPNRFHRVLTTGYEALLAARPASAGPAGAAYDPLADDPVVAPPVYSSWQTGVLGIGPSWSHELNTDAALRAVAGLAVRAVRRDQESLMAEAWRQARTARDTQTRISRTRFAVTLASGFHRRVSALAAEARLQITSPAHDRTAMPGSGRMVSRELSGVDLPLGSFDPAFRRASVRAEQRVRRIPGRDPGLPAMIVAVERTVLHENTSRLALERIDASPAKSYDQVITLETKPARVTRSTPTARSRIAAPRSTTISASHPRDSALTVAGSVSQTIVITSALPGTASAPAPAARTGTPELVSDALPAAMAPLTLLPNRLFADIKSITPRALSVMPVPRLGDPDVLFSRPALEALALRAPDVLSPGLSDLQLDAVTLLETNPRFVTGYLIGLNHEMSREFAWRGFPTPLNGTWFRKFWDYVAPRDDITPIAAWTAAGSLADHALADDCSAVLVTRAELFRRYPDTIVYVVPARWNSAGRRRIVTEADRAAAHSPVFTGRFAGGGVFFGFDLTTEVLVGSTAPGDGRAGWFIVFEEHRAAPRFGLDDASAFTPTRAPASANDLSWGHFAADESELAALRFAPAHAAWSATPVDGAYWGGDSADMAKLCWQRPVRVMIHASSLLALQAPA